MEINSPVTNGIPDNFETLTSDQLKEYRITYGYYLMPTTILRLLEPRAYFSGIVWELEEELLEQRHYSVKSGYKYCSNDNVYYGNNSSTEAEQMRLSEKEYSEEFELNRIKQLFLQQEKQIASERQLHTRNTIKPIRSSLSEAVHTSTAGGAVSCDEITKHQEEQHVVVQNGSYPNSLECQTEASQKGTQQASCNNIESGIGTDKIISGFHDTCNEYDYKNEVDEGTDISGSQNENTDSLLQDTAVEIKQCKSTEEQNFNNSDKGTLTSWMLHNKDDINGSSTSLNIYEESIGTDVPYLMQEIYQAPVVHLSVPFYSILEHPV